ncbi:hypothetical protein RHSIM_Rhsim01G0223700 [Rhododendron simsii]|uniref:CCT domain-containing protein n=1 Tax=Rhododendron simsii TaxID=118357 RepID=A0A834HGS9_RHOSS|nr:hypothetical protein RHSIM_Rhsim01G0223700 [Rhododendron simsii]
MYGHSHQSQVGYTSADLIGNLPLLDVTALPPPLLIPPSHEFDPMAAVALPKLELSYSCSSGCSSYESPSSLTSYSVPSPSLMERSISSLSLQKINDGVNGFRQLVSTTSLGDFVDSETSHVRRVFSTGDLQRINMVQHYHRSESPLSNENHSIIEGMSKACRYNPEEKKERIERYRSKRNQRNFNKKIKYVCRKTLADSRPRIRGRFARNDEIGNSSQNQWSQMRGEEDYEDDNWIHFLDSFMGNLIP